MGANGRELARIVAQAQAQGAPEWGVTLIVQMETLQKAFVQHCADAERSAEPWRKIMYKVAEVVAIAAALWLLSQGPSIFP